DQTSAAAATAPHRGRTAPRTPSRCRPDDGATATMTLHLVATLADHPPRHSRPITPRRAAPPSAPGTPPAPAPHRNRSAAPPPPPAPPPPESPARLQAHRPAAARSSVERSSQHCSCRTSCAHLHGSHYTPRPPGASYEIPRPL